MRKIKYRVWNKTEKHMYVNFEDILNLFAYIKDLEKENYVVMEYSGVTNIYNQEIYEGDIVRILVDGVSEYRIIKFVRGVFVAAKNPNINHVSIHDIPVDVFMEIIGNVYENSTASGLE